jgi:hypothetical protein
MVRALTGTAGVSPASKDKFTQVSVGPLNFDRVAFNESERDARGPSKSGQARFLSCLS